jgi:cytosine/adenosine deaminase-related metal-dependent hydrolase
VGIPNLPAMLAAGVRVCLGTDSLASAGSLDLMDDVAAVRAAFPEVDPATIVHMATQGGALALGLPDLGAIEPGKRAALAYARADVEPKDPLAFLADGPRTERVAA